MRYLLIILSLLSFVINQDFTPAENQTLNYTQIFFKWPQINNSYSYQLYFNGQQSSYETTKNSLIVSEFDWNTSYSWNVCGLTATGSIIDCYAEINFNITDL